MKQLIPLLVILVFFGFPPQAHAAVSNVQNANSSRYAYSAVTKQSAVFPNSTKTGDTILVFEQYGAAGATPTGCSDAQGNHYAQAFNVFDSGMTQGIVLYYAANIIGGASPTVTCTFNNANYLSMSMHEYSGLAATGTLDTAAVTDYNGGAVSTMQTPTTTPKVSGDLIFAGLVEFANGVGDKCAPLGVFAARVNQCSADGLIAEDYVEPQASAIAASASLTPTSGHYAAGIATFKAAVAGSGTNSVGPSTPTSLAANGITSTSVSLTWTASTDSSGVSSYQVFRNGTQVGTTTTAKYTDQGLSPSTTYSYSVDALDAAGNISSKSASLNVTTAAVANNTPPSVPANLGVSSVTSSSVALKWSASTDANGVAGYHVFRNGAQAGSTASVSYTDSGLAASTTYNYTVSAYDSAGNTSALSSTVAATTSAAPVASGPVYPLKISSSGRYLVDQNNKPFFITGEQGWTLITELANSDVGVYLSDRSSRGYNAVWLAAADNTYQSNEPYDYYGNKPFDGADFTNEDATYWAHVDYVVQQAASHGIVMMLDPAFVGLNSTSGYLSSYLNSSDAVVTAYGAWLGARYKSFPNVMWVLGGDADPAISGLYSKMSDLATGIRSTDSDHLMTFEASRYSSGSVVAGGGYSSLDVWPGPPSWLNLNWVYLSPAYIPTSNQTNYSRSPWLPPFMGEDWCEGDHSMTPLQLREEGYGAILGGSYLGRVFCNDAIWSFGSPTYDTMGASWQSQLGSSGSVSQESLGTLFRSREHWLLVPDTSHAVMTVGSQSGTTTAVTARTSDGQTIIAYIPTQRAVTIAMTKIADTSAKAWWFNPQTGATTLIGTYSTTGTQSFTPPDTNDWVLVIDAATANLAAPGSTTQ